MRLPLDGFPLGYPCRWYYGCIPLYAQSGRISWSRSALSFLQSWKGVEVTSLVVPDLTPPPGLPDLLGIITGDFNARPFHRVLPSASPPPSCIYRVSPNSSLLALSSRSGRARNSGTSIISTLSRRSDLSIRSTPSHNSNVICGAGTWADASENALDTISENTALQGFPAMLEVVDC